MDVKSQWNPVRVPSVLNLCTEVNPEFLKFLTFNEEIHTLALYIDVGALSKQLLIEKVSQGCFAESAFQKGPRIFYLPEEWMLSLSGTRFESPLC